MTPGDQGFGSRVRSYRALCFDRGALLLEMNRPAEAASTFLECLMSTGDGPPIADILYQLGLAYGRSGKHEDAFWAFLDAANLDSARAGNCFREAQSGNFSQIAASIWPRLKAERLPAWDKCFHESGQSGEALLFAARVASAAGERTQALDLLKQLATYPSLANDLQKDLCSQLDKERDALMRAGDMSSALEAGRLAIGLDAGDGTRWLNLMDVLYRKSFLKEAPFVGERDLEGAILAWQRARDCGSPNGSEAWAWSTRACINDQLAKLPGSHRWELGWEGFAYCVRGLASEPEESWHWTNLCHWCNFLDLTACEDYVSKMLLSLDGDEPTAAALEARCIWLTNAARFDEIKPVIERMRELHGSTTWLDAIEGFAYLHSGNNRKAASLSTKLLEAEPNTAWCREARAAAYRFMGKVAQAAADYEYLLKQQGANHYDLQRSLGRAWFYLAFCRSGPAEEASKKRMRTAAHYTSVSMEAIESAIKTIEGCLSCDLPTEGMTRIELGFAYLTLGELAKGQSLIEEGLHIERHFRNLDELSRFEIPWFETAIRSLPHRQGVKRILDKPSSGIKAQINKRLAEISSIPLDPHRELSDLLSHPGFQQNSSWLSVAIRAARPRLSSETPPSQAIEIYRALEKDEPRGFGLAETALQKLAQNAVATGDRLAADNEQEATACYRQALMVGANPEAEAALAGLALMGGDEHSGDALLRLKAAVANSERGESASQAVGERVAALIPNIARAWDAYASLKGIERRLPAEDPVIETLRKAENALFGRIDTWVGALPPDGGGYTPIPQAITLEIGSAMIPEDTSEEGWDLRSTYIPQMRARIESATGTNVPGVNIRAGYNPDPYGYSVALLGIPRPRYGGSVPAQFQTEPLKYVIQKLEAAILRQGYEFLRVDEAWRIAQTWTGNPRAKEILEARLGTTSERVHFSRLLRALVRDGVPLTRPDAILEALDTIPLTPVSMPRTVAVIRERMMDKLPGNEAGTAQVDFPPEWERSLLDWERSPQTALEPESIHKLIVHVRSQGDQATANVDSGMVTLNVKNAFIAPLVRRLLRHELPSVRVLAQEEVR